MFAMADTIAAETVSFSFVLVLVISGLLVNLIQAICFVAIRPLSKNIHRRINQVVAELLWQEAVWLVDWWAGVKIQVHTDDPETMTRLVGKEDAIVISNNRTNIDWILMSVLAQRSGCLSKVVSSKWVQFVPTVGWSMWFSENIFFPAHISAFRGLKDFPGPIWLTHFPHGIGREEEDNKNQVFVSAVKHMRSFIPAVYDVTIAVPKACSDETPSVARLLRARRLRRRPFYVVHMHIKRHEMRDLPNDDDAVAQWCEDVFVAKHALLDQHTADQTFGDQQQVLESSSGSGGKRPLKSLLVVTSWALLFIFCALKFPLSSLLVLSFASSALLLFINHPFKSILLLYAVSGLLLLLKLPHYSEAVWGISSSGLNLLLVLKFHRVYFLMDLAFGIFFLLSFYF